MRSNPSCPTIARHCRWQRSSINSDVKENVVNSYEEHSLLIELVVDNCRRKNLGRGCERPMNSRLTGNKLARFCISFQVLPFVPALLLIVNQAVTLLSM